VIVEALIAGHIGRVALSAPRQESKNLERPAGGIRARQPAVLDCDRIAGQRKPSRALLFCFLAPLLFLGIAQLTIAINKLQKPSAEAASTSGKASDTAPKPAYVFAAIFAALYAVGRILEDRLVKALFKESLLGS
jgi:hypothetical protein